MTVKSSLLDKLLEGLPQFKLSPNDFEIISEIGEGGYGKVYRAIYLPKQQECAIKQMFEDKIIGDNFKRFVREIRTLVNCLQNPCVVKFIGYTLENPFYIVTEYIPNNSLESFIYSPHEDRRNKLTSTIHTKIAMGVAWGMMLIHNTRIIHRDLKVANVLLDEKFCPKICDFGIARFYKPEDFLTKQIGTPAYIAPEVAVSNTYDYKSDVYAYGLFLYELSEKQRPYENWKPLEILRNVVKNGERPQLSTRTDEHIRDLITRCWQADPDLRPTFASIYEEWKKGRCCFPGTEQSEISEYAKELDKKKSVIDQRVKTFESKKKKQNKKSKLRKTGKWSVKAPEKEDESSDNYSSVDSESDDNNNNENEEIVNSSSSDDDDDSSSVQGSTDTSDRKSQSTSHSLSRKQNAPAKKVQISQPKEENDDSSSNNAEEDGEFEEGDIDFSFEEEESLCEMLSSLRMPVSIRKSFAAIDVDLNESDENEENVNLDELAKPGFSALLVQFFNSSESSFAKNSENVFHFLVEESRDPVIKAILDRSNEMMRRNVNLIPLFEQTNYFVYAAALSQKFIEKVMKSFGYLVTFYPSLLTEKYVSLIQKLFSKSPKAVLALYSEYCLSFTSLENPWPVLDFLLTIQDDLKNTEHGKELLCILFFLTTKYENYFVPRHQHVLATFSSFITSDNSETAKTAYNGLFQLTDDFSSVDFNFVMCHLASADLWECAVSFLLRSKDLPVSLDLVHLISKHCHESKYVWTLLLRIAGCPEFTRLFAESTQWMKGAKEFQKECALLFLMVFAQKDVRDKIARAKEFGDFVKGIAESGRKELFLIVPSIITRVSIDESVFDNLRASDAIHSIVECAVLSNDIEINNACLVTIDSLARVSYSPDFLLYIQKLVSFLTVPELYSKSVHVIVSLSFHRDTARQLIELGLVTYFDNLKPYQQYTKLAEAFLHNAKIYVN